MTCRKGNKRGSEKLEAGSFAPANPFAVLEIMNRNSTLPGASRLRNVLVLGRRSQGGERRGFLRGTRDLGRPGACERGASLFLPGCPPGAGRVGTNRGGDRRWNGARESLGRVDTNFSKMSGVQEN